MPDTKITALTAIGANPIIPSTFPIPMVDLTDTSMAASGTTKKVTVNQILGAGGTATLASATITGDLTVDTNTLKVDSTNNRVGIGTASPQQTFEVVGGTAGINTIFNTGSAGDSRFELRNNNVRSGYVYWDTSEVRLFADTSRALTFYQNGTLGMTLNATGLGVGVASPTSKLTIGTGSFSAAASGTTGMYTTASGLEMLSDSYFFGNRTGGVLMTLTAAGNLGIGVTPSAWGSGYKALQLGNGLSLMGSPLNGTIAGNAWFDGTNWKYITANPATLYYASFGANGSHVWSISSGVPSAGGNVSLTNAMTLDASGNLLVGVTSTTTPGVGNTTAGGSLNANGAAFFSHASSQALYLNTNVDGQIVSIRRSNVAVGSISVTTTGTTFNSLSDYRLKESVAPLSGGLARISALKPSIYKWKADGSNGEGFLAHELAEVVPLAVTGEKDAVNEDGSIKAQGVDLSKVVPILVAAIKELAAEVNALKNA